MRQTFAVVLTPSRTPVVRSRPVGARTQPARLLVAAAVLAAVGGALVAPPLSAAWSSPAASAESAGPGSFSGVVERVKPAVVNVAVKGKGIEGRLVGRPEFRMPQLPEGSPFNDLFRRFFEEHGVVIASLVVRADSGVPGAGYFTFLASRFGRDVSDPVRAWREEAERVWALFERSSDVGD